LIIVALINNGISRPAQVILKTYKVFLAGRGSSSSPRWGVTGLKQADTFIFLLQLQTQEWDYGCAD